ncbi:secreted RxLR effector protein 161-like [Pistacia vera]|uniref:secreted RxLR effector protein 161-like n=1 Tax=Pistacia vera TaxID=55513 RepID=UPI001262FD62|nr:secreted RxLR effector protein 161-like [Pistacia vera]
MAVGTKLTLDDSKLFDNPALYRSTIGALQYLILSRPDIAYSVNKLSHFLKAPTQLHWQACKRLLRYIKGTSNYGVHFTKSHMFQLECFTDADWASSLHDRRSTSGCFSWCNNQSAGSLASNPVFHGRTKHIELDAYYVRNQVTDNKPKVQYVPTEFQKADVLTKALPASKFATF